MKYAYYPGCVSQASGLELDMSTKAVAKKLGIELVEFPEFSCCGAGVVDEVNMAVNYALNARNLWLCETKGLDMLTICSTCQGMMARAKHELQIDNGTTRKVMATLKKLGIDYQGKSQVKHLLWILVKDYGLDKLKARVVKPLRGLRVAAFYGCHILRPKDVIGFEDPEDPRSFEQLISALGGIPVIYEGRTKCCGFPILFVKEDAANRMAGLNLLEAKEKDADVMATTCPLCHISLDPGQPGAEKAIGRALNLPTLHMPQLVGLALGISKEELGLSRHVVSVKQVLAKLGIA